MNKVYLLPNLEYINSPFVWRVSRKCYLDVSNLIDEYNLNVSPKEFIRRCFSTNNYLFYLNKYSSKNAIFLNVYIQDMVYRCVPTDDYESFLLTDFWLERPEDVTNSIKKGVYIQGIKSVLQITLHDPYEIKSYYINGNEINYRTSNNYHSNITEILSKIIKKTNDINNQDDILPISEAFEEYLSLAEIYAQFEDEAAIAAARASEGISCKEPTAIDDYDRQDKIAYSYTINGDYDETKYRAGAKVEIDIDEQRKVSATIIGFSIDGEKQTIQLLFDENIDFKELPKMAIIRLTYSKIMYEIQQNTIDDLRENRTKASFLDECIGLHKPQPYTILDLNELENELSSRKYSPTESQMQAIKKGISVKDVLLVQGPPGTGKTTVILEWVKYFCKKENLRVLISSQNNKAVDNVLERIVQEDGIEAVRAGNETKIQKNLYPLLLENKLNTFRDEVRTKLSNNIKIINALINCLQNDIMPQYLTLYHAVNNYHKYFSDYQQAFTTTVGNMASISQNYAKSSDKLKTSAENILSEINKIFVFLKKTKNPIIIFFRKRKIKKMLKEYTKVYEDYCFLQETYLSDFKSLIERLKKANLYKKQRLIKENSIAIKDISNNIGKIHIEGKPFVRDDLFELPDKLYSTDDIRKKMLIINREWTRLSSERTILKDWENTIFDQNNYALSDALLESVNLVGATCIGINSQKKFADMNFDVTIIDEAGQIQIHNALVPMSRSPKLIMLGDHKQIPPTPNDYVIERCQEDGIDDRLYRISLFEDMYEKIPETNKILLDTQFRMPAEIADILSEKFYGNKYLSFDGKRNMNSIFPELFESCFVIIDTSHLRNRNEISIKDENEGKTIGYTNECEANIVYEIVKRIVNNKYKKSIVPSEIGVISPYKYQIKLLVSKLKEIPEIGENSSEIAATLDSFQGQERDVIIYSCTRSNKRPEDDKSRIGFLSELRRLNVALSRPKKTLIFIGDIDFLSSCNYGEGLGSPKDFSDFIILLKQRVIGGKGQYVYAETLLDRIGKMNYE